MMTKNKQALWLLLLVILLWSSAFVGIRFIMLDISSGGALALGRYFVASIAIIIPFVLLKNKVRPSWCDLCGFFVLGFFGFFIYNVFLNQGERTVSAGIANFIVSQLPIIVAVIALLFFNERVNIKGIFGFILSLIGVSLIMLSESDLQLSGGIALIYIATFAGAIYSVSQKFFLKRYHPIEVIAYSIWFGTALLLYYLPEAVVAFKNTSALSLVVIVYMGIFPGVIAYVLWGYAFKHVIAAVASSFLYLMPLFSLVLGWLFLAEVAKEMAIIGGIVAVCGSIIISRFGVRRA
ncbi:MAG: DMT family transporter [Francisellaceae bacterium]